MPSWNLIPAARGASSTISRPRLWTQSTSSPVTRQFINTGIYVLGPDALELLPEDRVFDMPDLFEACRMARLNTLAYPVEEYWGDIGQLEDYRRANDEFASIFF